MPHRWLALRRPAPAATRSALVTDFAALPFSANSLDLVVLPHSLELSPDPHATLREVERVLVPEGRVVICGLNPASLWGLRQRRAHLYRRLGFGELFLPDAGDFIGYRRLRDWLRLLSFEVESGSFGFYRPAVRSEAWLERYRWFDSAGERWWPIFGAVYFLVAVKRVRGMRLLGADWRRAAQRASAPVPIAGTVPPRPRHRSTTKETILERSTRSTPTAPARAIPAPAAGARWLQVGRHREGTVRRRAQHHQQPHGAAWP